MTTPPATGSASSQLPPPPEWTRRAACLDQWTDLDWIDPTPEQARHCREICVDCPVRHHCLAAALIAAEPWGIWGGLDPDERADLARASGLPLPNALPVHGVRTRYVRHGCRCRACRQAQTTYESERRRKASAA
ncbi:MAG TPA: WhiB family transcriptional regulator [Pseudonocardiaceae bacterium]|jgi:WhiB family redox-sensing transcriptional regulator|nr:WhiB family transcriptional regulator [Pseudonocardiaceae bacterium]